MNRLSAILLFVVVSIAAAPLHAIGLSACQAAGDAWATAIANDPTLEKRPAFNVIVFNDDAQACYTRSSMFVASNPFYIGVLTEHPERWALPVLNPCGLESATPSVLVSAPLAATSNNAKLTGTPAIVPFGPYRCTAATVTVTMTQTNGADKKTGTYSFDQYQRYHATLQVGLIKTSHNDQDFGLVKEGDKNIIFSKGPEGQQIASAATIVIYAIPRYFGNMHYPGRDPVNDNQVTNKIGLAIGAALKNPDRRYLAGLTYEIVKGVNLLGVHEWARVKDLANGFKPGDAFDDTEAHLPFVDRSRHGWVFGLAIDARYAAGVLQGK